MRKIDRRDEGYQSTSWHVMDWAGNIQAGHRSADEAIKHAEASPDGMAAYETVTTVRRIDRNPRTEGQR